MVLNSIWPYLILMFFIALQGDVAILAGAGAASAGLLNLPAVFVTAVFGNFISDIAWYLLGYYGRIDWLLTRFKWLGITPQRLDMLTQRIHNNVIGLLLFAKVTNWMTIPVLISTGVARTPWRRWLWFIFLSDLVVAIIFVPLGYYMTASFLQIEKGVGYFTLGATILVIIIASFFIRNHLSRKERQMEQ